MPRQLAFVFDEDPGSPAAETLSPRSQQTPPEPLRTLIFVRHPRARRYVLHVRPDATVRVTVPRWGSRKEAAAFAARERPWIEKQLRRIRVDELRQTSAPDGGSGDRLSQGRQFAGREILDRAAGELVPRLKELARIHGLTVNRVSIRNQRSRWGSCSSGGHICLNWRLTTLPDWVRDYVLIHELMHLRRMDHSPRFWKLVEKAFPDYRRARRYLREQSFLLASNPPDPDGGPARERERKSRFEPHDGCN